MKGSIFKMLLFLLLLLSFSEELTAQNEMHLLLNKNHDFKTEELTRFNMHFEIDFQEPNANKLFYYFYTSLGMYVTQDTQEVFSIFYCLELDFAANTITEYDVEDGKKLLSSNVSLDSLKHVLNDAQNCKDELNTKALSTGNYEMVMSFEDGNWPIVITNGNGELKEIETYYGKRFVTKNLGVKPEIREAYKELKELLYCANSMIISPFVFAKNAGLTVERQDWPYMKWRKQSHYDRVEKMKN